MNKITLVSFIVIGFISQMAVVHACQCSDYGTELGCINWAFGCHWENQRCVLFQSSCSNQTLATCASPGCYDKNGVCTKFDKCASLLDGQSCKKFGCLPNNTQSQTPCISFDKCSQITNDVDCQGLINYKQNPQIACAWDYGIQANTPAKCVKFTQCESAPIDVCTTKSQCEVINNLCVDATCQGLNQASCSNKESLCFFANEQCSPNVCDRYDGKSCNTLGNFDFCAWNGQKCTQCQDTGAALKSIPVIIALIYAAIIL